MKKKALIIATIAGFITSFEMNDIKILQELGYEVIVAANFENYNGKLDDKNVQKLNIEFARSPFSLQNLKAFKKLNKFVRENKIDLIHCHTPVGGVVGRIIGKLNKVETVIYTAHGFHFFDGAPKINWLIYYPIEKFLSRWTDILITINNEDYNRAKNNFYAKKVEYIPGVGLDTERIKSIQVDRKQKREELGLNEDDIVLFSAGELSTRKNHKVVVEALGKLQNDKLKYLIAGKGDKKEELETLAKKYDIEKNIKLLGYRTDIYELCKISDIFLFPSFQEGLSVALMEAIVCNNVIICSNIRGNNDIIINGKNGFLVENNSDEYIEKIKLVVENKNIKDQLLKYNQKIISEIDLKNIEKLMKKIYKMGAKNED